MKYLSLLFCVSTLVAQDAKISFQYEINHCPESHADISILRDYDPFAGLPAVPFRIGLNGIAHDFIFPSNSLSYVAHLVLTDNLVASPTEVRKSITLAVDRPWILDSSRSTAQLEIVDNDRLGGLISIVPKDRTPLGYLRDGSLATFAPLDRGDYRIDFRGKTTSSITLVQGRVQLQPVQFHPTSDGGCLVSFSAILTPIRPGEAEFSMLMKIGDQAPRILLTTEEGIVRYRVDERGRILYWVNGPSGKSPLQRLLPSGDQDTSFSVGRVDGVSVDFVPAGENIVQLTRPTGAAQAFELWLTFPNGSPSMLLSRNQGSVDNTDLRVTPGGQLLVAQLGLQAPGGRSGGPCWIQRFNLDGSVDAGFGDGGTISFAKSDFLSPLALDSQGNLYVASEPMAGKVLPRRLVRFNPAGQPDSSFLAPDLPFSPGPLLLDGFGKLLARVNSKASGVELKTALTTRLVWEPDGRLDFTEATPGYRYQIESSSNLLDWQASPGPIRIDTSKSGGKFFRWQAEW
jgi:hypothetical protein